MKAYTFNCNSDLRGSLIAVESNHDIPFEIKRVYFMYNVMMGQVRGCHAHRTLEQVLVCICGKCSLVLDDGQNRETVVLSQKNEGIYVGPYIWHEIHDFSNDTVVLAFASDYYNESDYIRSYDEFLKIVSLNKERKL